MVCTTNFYRRSLIQLKFRDRKLDIKKNGKWHGEYVEVSAFKGFLLSGSYCNGDQIGEWKFLIEKQNITLIISAEYEKVVFKINAE